MKVEDKIDRMVIFAKKKFKQYKLEEWTIYFTNHYGALGECYNKHKKIRISIPWINALSVSECKTLFLHELAHALTEDTARSHGSEWRKSCKRVGIPNEPARYAGGKKPKIKKHKKKGRV